MAAAQAGSALTSHGIDLIDEDDRRGLGLGLLKAVSYTHLFASLCEREDIAVDPIRGMGVTLGDPGKYPAPRGRCV